eukprot:Skav224466  [mRNA]  locus=scaffold1302:426782:434507:+ [translate_table: standard]
MLVQGHLSFFASQGQEPFFGHLLHGVMLRSCSKLRHNGHVIRGLLLVGDRQLRRQIRDLLDVNEFESLGLIQNGINSHTSSHGHGSDTSWHVCTIKGEGMKYHLTVHQAEGVRHTSQPTKRGTIQVTSENHRDVQGVVLTSELHEGS